MYCLGVYVNTSNNGFVSKNDALRCSVEVDPTAFIEWYQWVNETWQSFYNGSDLSLNTLAPGNVTLRCTARSSLGTDSVNISITVRTPPGGHLYLCFACVFRSCDH